MYLIPVKYCNVDLYNWQKQARSGFQYRKWITHDGPPYANGDLHMGHFENKVYSVFPILYKQILKDIINRHKLLTGYQFLI